MTYPALTCPACGKMDRITVIEGHAECDRDDNGAMLTVWSGEAVCGCGYHSSLTAFGVPL